MKLILEETRELENLITEETGTKNYYLSGIFSSPGEKNRNGRVYPRNIWEAEVRRYQTEIKNKTINTLGEYLHPPRSTVDPMKAVIRIIELKINEDGNVWGKAKVLNDNSEKTNKIKALIDEGMKIGISTRGVGSVGVNGIVETYKFITADIVDLPSDFNGNLSGIVEGFDVTNGILTEKEFKINDDGTILEQETIETSVKKLKNFGFEKTSSSFGVEIYEDQFENKVFYNTKESKIELDIDNKKLENKIKKLFSKETFISENEVREIIDESLEDFKAEVFSNIDRYLNEIIKKKED